MYIIFNALNSGLGNNGGSRTLIKCAETIESLGVRCDIVATDDNFTWFNHKKPISYIPNDADVIVATACTTVESTLSSNVPKKVWYIRGHELWAHNEKFIGALYNSGLINITNSIGLMKKVESFGAKAITIPQGIDLDLWYDLKLRSHNKLRIGCLHQNKSTKRWKDFVKLAEILGNAYEYTAFGTNVKDYNFLSSFINNPSFDELREFYSKCHIWFVPTELEGLHNPPMEAALCGALVVCNDHPMSGIALDYGIERTSMVYRHRDIEHAAEVIRNVNWSKVEVMQQFLINEIGSREKNMKEFIDVLT